MAFDFHINNKKELHEHIVQFISNNLSNFFTLVPGISEVPSSFIEMAEFMNKGYDASLGDLILIGKNNKYDGIVLLLACKHKNGLGQKRVIKKWDARNYKVIISNRYDDIIKKLICYCYKTPKW